jgi:hypothetical protein
MDNMKAKDLIQGKTINEADEPPPETTGDQARPNPRRPMPRRTGPGDPAFGLTRDRPINPMNPGEPPGQFTNQEKSQLKDILILMLAQAAGSQLDAEIGQALMTNQELNPGQLQHIIDEARRIKLPPSHNAIMQKIFSAL